MADRPLLGRVSRRLCTRWSGACGVLVEDVADGDWFVAVGAPLLARLAGVAGGALGDGDVAAGGAGRHDDGRSGVGVAGAPGGLAAGGCAVALPAGRGARGRADRARRYRLDVVTDVVT